MDGQLTVDIATIGDMPIVARLLEFNAYEFSRIDGRAIGPDGRYGYRYLDAYWDPDEPRTPYLIRLGGELAGLAFVTTRSDVTSFNEFLVLPKFRRGGVGTSAVARLLRLHAGRWEIKQVPGNDRAVAFWRCAIPVPYDERIHSDGTVVQTFVIDR